MFAFFLFPDKNKIVSTTARSTKHCGFKKLLNYRNIVPLSRTELGQTTAETRRASDYNIVLRRDGVVVQPTFTYVPRLSLLQRAVRTETSYVAPSAADPLSSRLTLSVTGLSTNDIWANRVRSGKTGDTQSHILHTCTRVLLVVD